MAIEIKKKVLERIYLCTLSSFIIFNIYIYIYLSIPLKLKNYHETSLYSNQEIVKVHYHLLKNGLENRKII